MFYSFVTFLCKYFTWDIDNDDNLFYCSMYKNQLCANVAISTLHLTAYWLFLNNIFISHLLYTHCTYFRMTIQPVVLSSELSTALRTAAHLHLKAIEFNPDDKLQNTG